MPSSRRSSVVVVSNEKTDTAVAIVSDKPGHVHEEFVVTEDGKQIQAVDYSGAHEKTDPAEIQLVKKLDIWIMVSLSVCKLFRDIANEPRSQLYGSCTVRQCSFPCRFPLRLTPIGLNYLDRNAITLARLNNLEEDLGITSIQYQTCVSILFVGYILGQIPSNMLLTRIRPSYWMSFAMAAWAVVSALTAAAKDFKGLLLTRFFLGITEAPYYPGTSQNHQEGIG